MKILLNTGTGQKRRKTPLRLLCCRFEVGIVVSCLRQPLRERTFSLGGKRRSRPLCRRFGAGIFVSCLRQPLRERTFSRGRFHGLSEGDGSFAREAASFSAGVSAFSSLKYRLSRNSDFLPGLKTESGRK